MIKKLLHTLIFMSQMMGFIELRKIFIWWCTITRLMCLYLFQMNQSMCGKSASNQISKAEKDFLIISKFLIKNLILQYPKSAHDMTHRSKVNESAAPFTSLLLRFN